MANIVRGVGAYLPERIMTNQEFESLIDTTDAWITERTGIRQRHIAAKDERTSDLGAKAAQAALAQAGLKPGDIDLIVNATTTPDDTMPATATRIQHKLGMSGGGAFDVNAACSGFVYAMTVADSLLARGVGTRALVIGAETFSRILDWKDRGTCILFGDGAGAVVLERDDKETRRGVLGCHIHAAGEHGDLLATSGGISSTQTAGTVFMHGKEIFRHAVAHMSESVTEGLKAVNQTPQALDWLVPHQANWRILASVAQKLELPPEKVISTVSGHANTSAASIPLALAEGVKDGRIKEGQLVALTALGAGLTWGTCIIRW